MESHPWITFKVDIRNLSHTAWMDLGASASKCIHISRVPLKPHVQRKMHMLYLAKGARATTAIEGNTLSEEDVLLRIDKKLELPPSREYLGKEVDNIVRLCNEIKEEIRSEKPSFFTIEKLCYFNGIILKDTNVNDYVIPGKIRTYEVGVGAYKAPPHQKTGELLKKLCDWLNSSDFEIDKERPIANSIVKSIAAHIYIAWIHPFGDGNGRLARILEFAILLQSGVTSSAAHLLSNHYNATRNEYYRQLDLASKKNDINGFFMYALQGLRDGLQEQLQYIFKQVEEISWESYVYERFNKLTGHEEPIKRKRTLVLELSKKEGPVPKDQVITMSQQTINRYKNLHAVTLDRDLEEIEKMGLIKITKEGYIASKSLIRSFLPLSVRS